MRRRSRILVDRTIVGEIREKIEDVRHRNGANEIQINVLNRDGFQIGIIGHFIFDQLHKTEEHPKVQMVFGNGFRGFTFDGLMIREKFPQNDRAVVKAFHETPPVEFFN